MTAQKKIPPSSLWENYPLYDMCFTRFYVHLAVIYMFRILPLNMLMRQNVVFKQVLMFRNGFDAILHPG